MILTARAAAGIPAESAFAGDADALVAAMLSAGLEKQAARWSGVASVGSDAWATWSPDGTKLAYAATVDGVRAIHIINVDGTGDRQLTHPGETFNDNEPAWSPDGTRIAFVSNTALTAPIAK